MAIYYTIHILIFCACIFDIQKDRKFKKMVMFILMTIIILFGGLRWQIGGDWEQYYYHFQQSDWSNIFNYQRRSDGTTLEPFFVFLNVLIKSIFNSFWMYNVCIVGFIQIVYYRLSWTFFPRYPLLFYSFLMILVPNYFPVRAGLALGIIFLAYLYLYEEKTIKYLLLIFVAFMIHRQCILMFPLVFVGYIRKWLTVPLFIAAYALFVFAGMMLQDLAVILSLLLGGEVGDMAYHYTQYQNEGHSQQVNSYIGWGLNFFFLIVYIYVMKKNKKDNDVWYKTMLVAVLFYNGITMVFTEGMGELARTSTLFTLAQVYLFINAFVYFLSEKKYIRNLSILFFILYYIYRISQVGTGYYFEMTCLPYKTIFDHM